MTTDPLTDSSADAAAAFEDLSSSEGRRAVGIGPWRLAWRRLRRNRTALAFGVLFLLLIAVALLAPFYADHIAHTTQNRQRIADTLHIGGKDLQVVSFDGVPIGPTWHGEYFLGADGNGRDVMVRLLYGARNSLFIGIVATIITTIVAVVLGTLAGYFRGITDAIISRTLDVLWAFPVLLLGVALGVSLATGGLHVGPVKIESNSIWIPTLIIGVVNVVYLARPVRGQILSLREREFVEAARASGAGMGHILFRQLLPNLWAPILVTFSLNVPSLITAEAALSFLTIGVLEPTPDLGRLISDSVPYVRDDPFFTLTGGVVLFLLVLSFNLFGDSLRDALDPKSNR
jgi:peptide/nickel transport system permease protein